MILDKLDINKLEKAATTLNDSKSKVDKLDVDKLIPVSVDLSKLGDVVIDEVVKKMEYNELIKKANAIKTTDPNNLVKKLTMTQKLVQLKKKTLIMIIVINILLHNNLIS